MSEVAVERTPAAGWELTAHACDTEAAGCCGTASTTCAAPARQVHASAERHLRLWHAARGGAEGCGARALHLRPEPAARTVQPGSLCRPLRLTLPARHPAGEVMRHRILAFAAITRRGNRPPLPGGDRARHAPHTPPWRTERAREDRAATTPHRLASLPIGAAKPAHAGQDRGRVVRTCPGRLRAVRAVRRKSARNGTDQLVRGASGGNRPVTAPSLRDQLCLLHHLPNRSILEIGRIAILPQQPLYLTRIAARASSRFHQSPAPMPGPRARARLPARGAVRSA